MKYRVRLDISLDSEGEAQGLYNHAKGLMPDGFTFSPGEPHEERSWADYHRCGHDVVPLTPCNPLEHVEAPLP